MAPGRNCRVSKSSMGSGSTTLRGPLFLVDSRVLVDRYLELEDPDTVRAIGLELNLSTELNGVTVRGIIDRLDELDDGSLAVVDYKTGRAPRAEQSRSRLSGVHLYALMCEAELGRRPSSFAFSTSATGSSSPQRRLTSDAWHAPTSSRRLVGDRAGVQRGRFPAQPVKPVPLLRLPGILPLFRGCPLAGRRGAGRLRRVDSPVIGTRRFGARAHSCRTEVPVGLIRSLVKALDTRVEKVFAPLRGNPIADRIFYTATALGDFGLLCSCSVSCGSFAAVPVTPARDCAPSSPLGSSPSSSTSG